MATILATVFYAMAVVYAVAFFIRKSTFYLLSSAVIAIASFVSAFFAADFSKQQVVEWGQALGWVDAQPLNMRLDIGAWVTLVAGFILAGSYVLTKQAPTTKAVQPPKAAET